MSRVSSQRLRRLRTRAIAGLAAWLVVCPSAATAQGFVRTPLADDHPLLGIWRIDLPQFNCFEEYELRRDGTKLSVSGEERNESEFAIAPAPSPNGFYQWTDRLTRTNGQPDCTGSRAEPGHVAVNHVRLHPGGQRMLLCETEDMASCYAEFHRQPK